jgi:apolipoprotein N-acyltransferase
MLPSWPNALLAVLAAVLLILAFPDFEFWFLAWFALVPLMWAVDREKGSTSRSLVLGWIFGTLFFFGTCWWLTFAPINYAGFPPLLAYFLLFCVTLVAGLFPAIFAAILSVMVRRFGSWGFLAAPFLWTATEFARYWITGNNWNALGYSQAFQGALNETAEVGGVLLVSFLIAAISSVLATFILAQRRRYSLLLIPAALSLIGLFPKFPDFDWINRIGTAKVIAIQPDVPMSGLDSRKWEQLRERHVAMAEAALNELRTTNNEQPAANNELPITVILPESPMNFMYNDDRKFQQFIGDFARRNNVSVLFNSSEPDPSSDKYFNSAVLVGPDGKKAEQYDKIYLLPFGEAVPLPLQNIVPAFVGSFSYGSEYDLVPLGDAKAGIMICFESHFGQLSREYVRNGADAIIEMTNDGYLGPTPVLRQHLANAVFRAVETNRPVLRVTNVGITAYIDERGKAHDPLPSYQEGTRVWPVSKSDGSQTFYVKYGDWFAWLCVATTLGLVAFSFRSQDRSTTGDQQPELATEN